MFDEHKKEGKLKITEFAGKLEHYGKENTESTSHTFFRLDEKQRKIYTEEELKNILFEQRPLETVIQKNGNIAAIYKYGKRFVKIMLDFTPNKIYIVTFYILNKQQEGEIGK